MNILVRFNHKFEVRACEWLLALVLFAWGVSLLLQPTTFKENWQIFWTFDRMFDQRTWGLACFVVSTARLIALYINGARKSTPFVRMSMAFISCFFWYQIALALGLSGSSTPGTFVYSLFLIFETYNVFRSTIDARLVYDETKRAQPEHGTNG